MSTPLNILGQHMVRPIIDDQLWKTIEPLVPPKGRHAWYPGKRSVDERAALTGILFVLMSGIPWEMLPVEMGCGSGTSCRQQFRLWQRTGAWEKLREILAGHPQFVGRIDWSRVTSNWSGLNKSE
ncbi:transposase [Paraburkholderia kururiensis]|uniref:transposase n=2 Tax=Paraburkholderia kururiensis TaxID=984307 RepID=UPI000F887DD1